MPAGEQSSDGELVAGLRRGDEQALGELYRRRRPSVYRFALYLSGDPTLAEEAVQEAFLALIRRPELFDERRGDVASYLLGIARNLVRRSRREPAAAQLTDAAPDGEPPDGGPDPLERLDRAERNEQVRQAVLSLPEPYRATVALCDLEELSYESAAAALDSTVGAVRSRLHRGRQLLWRKLQALSQRKTSVTGEPR